MFVERKLPTDFRMKANRRMRWPLAARPATAKRPGGRSLDSSKHLATSEKKVQTPETLAEILKSRQDARDRRRRAVWLQERLMDTLKPLVWAEGQEEAAEARKRWLEDGHGPSGATKARRRRREWSAAKDVSRLSTCQTQWTGFKPVCCGSRAVAVPIGCNHRLCPLCNAHRAERYRSRVTKLFHELGNPQLLTLTVPSPRFMSREVLDTLRGRLKAFLKENSALLKGGVYSIEITHNRREETWHPHVHVLVDVNDTRVKLPYREFVERKRRLEFSWFVHTQGARRAGERRWRVADYDEWRTHFGRDGAGAGDGRNRRVVDLRPVTKDRKAATEVLKYMSKAASFIDCPAALKQLLVAIRGVRQIQTFGTCYGVKIDDESLGEEITFAGKKVIKSEHLHCDCGANVFERIGVLELGMVKLSPEGTWYVRDDAPVRERQRCRGHST